MRKIIVAILYIVLMSSVVSAGGMLQVQEIRWYQNDDRISDIEFEGNLEDVYPGDVISAKIELDNDDDERIDDIVVFIEIKDIDDGDDAEEELDEFNLGDGDDVQKEIEIKVPSDSEFDNYDLFLKIRGELDNGTEELYVYNYTIDIQEKPFDFKAVFLDINKTLSVLKTNDNQFIENTSLIQSLNKQVGSLEEQIQSKNKEIEDYKQKTIPNIESEKQELQDTVSKITTERDSYLSSMNTYKPKADEFEIIKNAHGCSEFTAVVDCIDKKIEDKDKAKNAVIWFFLIAGVGGYLLIKKKQKPQTALHGQQSIPDKLGGIAKNLFR